MPRERCDDWTQPADMRATRSSRRGSSGEASSFVDDFRAASLDLDLADFLLRDERPNECRSANGEKNCGLVTDHALVGRQRTI